MVPVGYLVGALAAVTVLTLPEPAAAIAYVAVLLGLTGIAHIDGLADLGDAAVVHGPPPDRRAAMQDTATGVGGTVAVALTLVGLALAALALAGAPPRLAVGVVVAAEVGAKLAMALISFVGGTSHEGMGSKLLGAPVTQLPIALALALPAAVVAWPAIEPAAVLVGALVGGTLLAFGASRLLGGVSGDVFGATNEVARLVALHVGVVAWMRF
jgi:adenosylcobinamide-GDP ribazoletransferase